MPLNQPSANNHFELKAIIDHLQDGILTLDENCHITSANPAVMGIFGYEEDEIIGLPFIKLFPQLFKDLT